MEKQESLDVRVRFWSIWVANYVAASKHIWPELRLCCTPEITNLATRYDVKGGLPRSQAGLTTDQMMLALHEMRFLPVLYTPYDIRTGTQATRAMYSQTNQVYPLFLACSSKSGGR